MMKSLKNYLCKATKPIICAVLLVATMGMTVFAASGTLTGSLSNNVGKAELKNTSGNTRYCHVLIRQYNSTSAYTTVSSNAGSIDSVNLL